MRPIKFRAWESDFGWANNVAVYGDGSWQAVFGDVFLDADDGAVLMQFTGLLDKNGMEIYEGDVVELDGDRFTVQWDCFGWALFWMMCNERWLSDAGQYTVIGNVYENSDLVRN